MKKTAADIRRAMGITAATKPVERTSPFNTENQEHVIEDSRLSPRNILWGPGPGRDEWDSIMVGDSRDGMVPLSSLDLVRNIICGTHGKSDIAGSMSIVKARRPGLSSLLVNGLGISTLPPAMRLNFQSLAHRIELAHWYAGDRLVQTLAVEMKELYRMCSTAFFHDPVLAERISKWWDEHKEKYGLSASIHY